MAKIFFGGVHPDDGKSLASHRAIEPLPPPPRVVIPLSQHIGAVCRPLVKKGDAVCLGQKIGDGEGLCAPVHASVSGVVAAVEPRVTASGLATICVVIDNDGLDTPDPSMVPCTDPAELGPEELVARIREAGIVGMGGAAFPTSVKLSSALGKCDTLIINAAECEPYITADDRLLQEEPERVLRGVTLLRRALGLAKAHIGIEDNKPAAIAALRAAAPPEVEIRVLRTRYPQGAEKQLIQAVTGRQVPPGGLPAAVGCAVFNAATCAAIADAVWLGLPLIRRVVTVSGPAIARPSNFLVPIGTPFEMLIEAAGGFAEAPYKILSGGPMMGVAQFDFSAPTVKGCNAITCLTAHQRSVHPERAVNTEHHCIRCGRCLRACPMHLMPLYFYQYERRDLPEQLDALHIGDCSECGSCAYICPARLPLVQSIKSGKTKVRQMETERQRAAALRAGTGGMNDG